MHARICNGSAEHETALLSVDPKGIQSHSPRSWLLAKILLRVIFSLMLALSLVLCVVYGCQYGEHDAQKAQVDMRVVDPYKELDRWAVKQHQSVHWVGAPGHVEILSSKTHILKQNLAVFNPSSKRTRRKLHTPSRAKMNTFVKILEDLLREELLKLHQKVLFLDAHTDREVVALKQKGFKDVQGIDLLPARLNSRRIHGYTQRHKLADQNFDFLFTSMFDRIPYPALFVTEVESALKVGGFAAMHVSLNKWRNEYVTSKSGRGTKPVTLLFQHSEIVYVSSAYAPGLDTVIVFKKIMPVKPTVIDQMGMNSKQLDGNPAIMTQQVMNRVKFSTRHKHRKYSKGQQLRSSIPKLPGTDGQVGVEDTVVACS